MVDEGSIAEVLHVVCQNAPRRDAGAVLSIYCATSKRRWQQRNPKPRAQRNVAHHYDLDGRLYSLFLDADRQYSCAYFESPGQSLDDAQLAKKRHLAAKLLMKRGQRVLDIGCGWGGLALYLAEFCGAQVTGHHTFGRAACKLAAARAAEQQLSSQVDFRLKDYRDVNGPFDRIVSVGMFEHVGVGLLRHLLPAMRGLLTDDGVMLLHSIGRSEGPASPIPGSAKYIFPGGYIPALSEVLPDDRARRPARHRYRNPPPALRRNTEGLAGALPRSRSTKRTDLRRTRFVRMWEFYLAGAEVNFRDHGADGVSDPAHQAAGGRADDARLHQARRAAAARRRARQRTPLRLAGE